MNLLIRIREAVDRKLLNFFLQKIKRHLSKQDGIIIYKYDREVDSLSPVIWRARAITKNTIKEKKATNNWLFYYNNARFHNWKMKTLVT